MNEWISCGSVGDGIKSEETQGRKFGANSAGSLPLFPGLLAKIKCIGSLP